MVLAVYALNATVGPEVGQYVASMLRMEDIIPRYNRPKARLKTQHTMIVLEGTLKRGSRYAKLSLVRTFRLI